MSDRMTTAQLHDLQRRRGQRGPTDTPDAPTRLPRQNREGPIHHAILAFLYRVLPTNAVYHHSPNELDMAGPSAARQVAKARKLGTKAGWPDIEIIWQGQFYGLEIKAPGGRQSPAQKDIERAIKQSGGHYAVVRSVDEASKILQSWKVI